MTNGGTEHRKLAAIMFTDMVGYSALAQKDEALALELLEEHRYLLRSIFPKHQGREIKTLGDGFLVECASALAAVRCAIDIQETLAQRNAVSPAEKQIQLRIGIHVGDVVQREGDVFGDGVNIAARIEPLAEPGGICITEDVARQIRNKIEHPVVQFGQAELKNIQLPVLVFKLAVDGTGAAGKRRPEHLRSIAVLPFVNMSPDRENEFLSDGITEDLIAALSRVTGLRVPARTSAFVFKGKNEDIRRIGQVLNVDTVLEGSVRKSGDRLRIAAQLINVADGYHLWSERYDREMKDVFEIQDDLTRAIVTALKVQLVGGPNAPLVKRHTENTEAYQLYLKGRDFWNQRDLGLKKGLHYFELALLEDPNYALAYTGLADAYSLLGFYAVLPSQEARQKARAAAARALEIDNSLAEGHVSAAVILVSGDWDWAGGVREYEIAIGLNPQYVPARYWHALYFSILGRHEEAIVEIHRALEIDPLSSFLTAIHGWVLFNAHRFDQAVAQLRKAVEVGPDFVLTHWLLGQAYLATSLTTEAIAVLQKAKELSRGVPWTIASLAQAYALSGERDRASTLLAELQEQCKNAYMSSWFLALASAALDDHERVFAFLEKAFADRDYWLVWTKCHFAFDRFHSDPRFTGLLKRMGLAE
jgi:adenylate cyclase